MNAVATRATMRNRKLECDAGCGYVVRVSAKWMRNGLPTCPCGGTLWPAELEDAVEILPPDVLEQHPAWQEYVSEASSVSHGQAWHGLARGAHYADPTVEAARRVHERARATATLARLAALRGPGAVEGMPF